MADDGHPAASSSVRAIRRAKQALHDNGRRVAAGVLVTLVAIWLASGVYTVDTGQTGALLAFGRLVSDQIAPGLGIRLPGVHRLIEVETGGVERLEIRGDKNPELSLLTGDENLIEATLVVQYRVGDVGDYLFATEDPAELVRQAVRAAVVRSVASTSVDALLTSAKASLQSSIRLAAGERLAAYGSGVELVKVNLQTVEPPTEASNAFRAVSDARAQSAGAVSVAQGDRDRTLSLARGTAEQILLEATSGAAARRLDAEGRADRFTALLARHRLAAGQTRDELWNATLGEVLPRARLIFLQPGGDPRVKVHLYPPPGAPPRGIPPATPGGHDEEL